MLPILTKRVINSLNDKLDLICPDYMQDWDIEMAMPALLPKCTELYEHGGLDDEEKIGVMMLMLACLDDLAVKLDMSESEKRFFSVIRDFALRDLELHRETLTYWASVEDDGFLITPYAREVLDSGSKAAKES